MENVTDASFSINPNDDPKKLKDLNCSVWKCFICTIDLDSKLILEEHFKIAHDCCVRYTCPHCDDFSPFTMFKEFEKHYKSEHQELR